ncbi:MAG: hypothetical protein QXM75_03455 [Candidatus Diapherotrites archaeon]
MVTEEELTSIGFTEEQARTLLSNDYFKKNFGSWTKEKLVFKINCITAIYGIKKFTDVLAAISSYPKFLNSDHEKTIKKVIDFNPTLNRNSVVEIILCNPSLVSVDLKKAFSSAIKVYGKENEQDLKMALLVFPGFSRKDHRRNLKKLLRIYGPTYKKIILKAMLRVPEFPNFKHITALKKVIEAGKAEGLSIQKCVELLLGVCAKTDISIKSAEKAKKAFESIISE